MTPRAKTFVCTRTRLSTTAYNWVRRYLLRYRNPSVPTIEFAVWPQFFTDFLSLDGQFSYTEWFFPCGYTVSRKIDLARDSRAEVTSYQTENSAFHRVSVPHFLSVNNYCLLNCRLSASASARLTSAVNVMRSRNCALTIPMIVAIMRRPLIDTCVYEHRFILFCTGGTRS